MLWIISRPGQSLAGDQPATRYSLNHTDGKTLGECSRILQSAEKRWTACTKQPISRIFSYASASHRGRKSSDILATPSSNITNHQGFTAGAQSPQAPRTDVANALTFFSIIEPMISEPKIVGFQQYLLTRGHAYPIELYRTCLTSPTQPPDRSEPEPPAVTRLAGNRSWRTTSQ